MDATTSAERELSPIGLALLGQKRKFEPEAEDDDEEIRPPFKRAKTEELPPIQEDEVREEGSVRKRLARTKRLPSIKENEETDFEPRREGVATTRQLRSSTKRTIQTRSKSAPL